MRAVRLLAREVEEADRAVGAGDAEHAVAILDVGHRRLEFFRRELVRLLHRALGRDVHRRAADEERARTGAAEAGAAVGVAEGEPDLVDGHAEHVDRELRERGGEALAHRLRRGEDLDAVAVDGHRHVLGEHVGTRPLDERGDALAAQRGRAASTPPRARRSRSSRRARGRDRAPARTARCRTSCPSRCGTASGPGGSCCAGAARCGRGRSGAPPRRAGARSCRWPPAARRRGRVRSASCW